MDTDRWRQVEDLFHAVAGLDASARARVLDHTCAQDSRLRAEVESLVLAHASADTFIEGSALEVAARLMGGEEIDGESDAKFGQKQTQRAACE